VGSFGQQGARRDTCTVQAIKAVCDAAAPAAPLKADDVPRNLAPVAGRRSRGNLFLLWPAYSPRMIEKICLKT